MEALGRVGIFMDGLLISVEGNEGSGKTTLVKNLVPKLRKATDSEILLTREPGGIPIAEEIRQIILNPENSSLDIRSETLLFAASRRQLLVEKIFPALDDGKIVIMDRFIDSSLAYQGVGRNLGIEKIAQINDFVTGGLLPDITLFLDIDVETGLRRIARGRVAEINRLDLASVNFHEKVRTGYLELALRYPERIKLVSASKKPAEVLQDSYDLLVECFPRWFTNKGELK